MAIKEKELIGMLLPDVSIDEITLETRKSADNKDGLKVTLNFSVYDVVESDQISKWFDQIDFLSSIRLTLVENRDGQMLEKQFSLSDLDHEISNSRDLTSYSSRFSRVREVNENGRMLNYYRFSRSFNYNYCPMHLSYKISSQLDIDSINRKFGTELNNSINLEGNLKKSTETVLEDGKLGLSTIYLLERTGQVWNGPRHRMPEEGTFMTGATHDDESSEPLISRVVSNNKIQDFRTFTSFEKFEIDDSIFHNLQEEISPGNRSSIENLKKDFYSEIWLSRSLDGEAKLMFAIDLKEMIRAKGAFGKLLDRMPEIMQRELLSHCKVQSIKLLRKRVRPTNVQNKLGSQVKGYTNFDNNKKREALVMSGETSGGFKRIDGEHASIRESLISTDENYYSSIRYFTANDKSMKTITDGLYQYGVEVNVIDGTRKFLIEIKNTIFEARSGLIEILEKMNQAVPVKDYAYDVVTNTYVRNFAFSEEERQKILKVFRSYVTILSMLAIPPDSEIFMSMSAIYRSPAYADQLVKSMDSIISKLERVTNDESTYFEPSRKSGKISSSERFSIKDSKFFTNHTFDSNVDKGKGLEFLVNPTDERAADILQELRDPTSVENDLQERVREVSRSLGFSGQESKIGLRVVDSSVWQQRVQSEIDRFYSSPNPSFNPPSDGSIAQEEAIDIRGINSSYLTPSFILLGNETSEPIELEVNSSEERTLQSEEAILSSNEGERDYFSQMGVSFYEESEEALLINSEIGERKVEKVPTCVITNRNIRQSPIDALNGWYIENGIVKMLEKEDLTPEEELSSSQRSTFTTTKITDIRKDPPVSKPHEYGQSKFTRIFKESIVKGIDQKLNFNDYEQPVHPIQRFKQFSVLPKELKKNFKNLPLQIQSLFLFESDASKVRFVDADVPPSPSKFRINFNFLMSVEYLSGFGDDNLYFENSRMRKNFKMIKEPIWKPLTASKFLSSRGEEMLCRLKKSTIKELGVKVHENLELPIYDSYFIIRPPAKNEGEVVIDRLEDELRRAEEQELVLTQGVDFARQEQAREQAAIDTAQMLMSKADAQKRFDELYKLERQLRREVDLVQSRIDELTDIIQNARGWSGMLEADMATEERNALFNENRGRRGRLMSVLIEMGNITQQYGITRPSSEGIMASYREWLREMAELEHLRRLDEAEAERRREERRAERERRQEPLNDAGEAATSIFGAVRGMFSDY